jgi:hypothetical protein
LERATGDIREKEKEMEGRQGIQWHVGSGKYFSSQKGCYFVRFEDGTSIEVHPDVYEQRFHAYLDHLGVQPTTWSEIMRRAEQEWQDYCHLRDTFAKNSQQWLDESESGVFIETRKGS